MENDIEYTEADFEEISISAVKKTSTITKTASGHSGTIRTISEVRES